MKKSIKHTIILMAFVLMFGTVFSVNATTDEAYTEIPSRMSPGSEVVYRDGKYVVLSGSTVEDSFEGTFSGLGEPVKGMIITYATDGYIFDIEYPEEVENPLIKEVMIKPRIKSYMTLIEYVSIPGSSWTELVPIIDGLSNEINVEKKEDTKLNKGDCIIELNYNNVPIGTRIKVVDEGITPILVKNNIG